MKKLSVLIIAGLVFVTLAATSEATVFSDDFEDGSIDAGLWTTGGEKRGASETDPPGIGSWQYPINEQIASDGYLELNVFGPTSGYTYGAEAWVQSTHNFNDGSSYLINFTWEAIVGEPAHYDYYYIQVTDGYIPYNGSVHWPSVSRQNPEGTVNFLVENSENGWSLTDGGISKTTWSMAITPDGVGRLYDGSAGGGNLIHQDSLDPTKDWFFRMMLIDATSAGFPAGDNSLNLYDVEVVPEPATLCLLGLGGLMLRRRKNA